MKNLILYKCQHCHKILSVKTNVFEVEANFIYLKIDLFSEGYCSIL